MEASLMADLQRFLQDRCLSVTNLPQKGRSLFTTRDIRPGSSLLCRFRVSLEQCFCSSETNLSPLFLPGEVILSQNPYICVPNNTSSESRCDGCFKTNNLKRCSGCQVVWYCGSSCQVYLIWVLSVEIQLMVVSIVRFVVCFWLFFRSQSGSYIDMNAKLLLGLRRRNGSLLLLQYVWWLNFTSRGICKMKRLSSAMSDVACIHVW